MIEASLPTVKSMQDLALSVMKSSDANTDKRISLSEFLSYVTKNRDLLKLLKTYGLANNDDLRPNFGWSSEDFPDCDSDLENEVLRKGNEKCSVDFQIVQHPMIEVRFA